ncbi:glycosyltransferase [Synechococcus sp. CBW1006]|uniref:glycosyltransferase n=1 Tax=Synechococcus sp. CBW1006 TaxID=1353138 RepID=UPI0018CD7453|nr:glycosyltransferase [Synechococcus sp. CBW1006]QPN65928.1 glycosyltransferase [Synechococcus sp. CBW1006]
MTLPIRVHVLASLGEGGNETLARELIRFWPEPAHHVVGVIGDSDGPMRPEFQALAAVEALPMGWPPFPSRLWQLWRWLGHHRPQSLVSYTFNIQALPLCCLARWCGVPAVVMRVGNPPPPAGRQRKRWRLLTRLCRWAGIPLVSCSAAVHAQMAQLEPLPKGSRPLLNGCDTAAIAGRAAAARARRPPGDSLRVLMVARLDPIKDQATLIRAFAAVRQPGWQLQLVGDGSERARLEALAAELGLDPAGVFLGRRADIPDLLGQADLFAFSTTAAEGFGIALIEAMAAGLPVIASDVPACREVLLDGVGGVLLEQGDPIKWAVFLESLFISETSRLALGRNAALHSQIYDAKLIAASWHKLLTLTFSLPFSSS